MDLEINKRIRQCREEKKMSQEKLGEAIGMKCNAYSRMEREGNITVDDVFAIAKALDIDPDILFYGEKPLDFSRIEPQILVPEDPFRNSFLKDEPNIHVGYRCGEFEISNEEKDMIKIFRNLDEDKKNKVREWLSNNY